MYKSKTKPHRWGRHVLATARLILAVLTIVDLYLELSKHAPPEVKAELAELLAMEDVDLKELVVADPKSPFSIGLELRIANNLATKLPIVDDSTLDLRRFLQNAFKFEKVRAASSHLTNKRTEPRFC